MIFLASTLFVICLYVLPGYWLLDRAAEAWFPALLPAGPGGWLLAAGVYAVCLIVVRVGKFAYEDFDLERDTCTLRPFLDPRGCRWLTGAGLLLIGAQVLYMTSRWAMPSSFVPLYGALLVGFFDLRRRPRPSLDSEPLPESLVEEEERDEPPETSTATITVRWNYLEDGEGDASMRFEKHYVVPHLPGAVVASVAPGDLSAYIKLVKEGIGEGIRDIAVDLRRESRERHYSPQQELENIVQMVRSLPYRPDPVLPGGEDQPLTPVQTLTRGGGDCEDHAILAAALLWLLGHPAGLFLLRLEDQSHMALAYRTDAFEGSYSSRGQDGHVYSFIETSPVDGDLGDGPDHLLGNIRQAKVLPL